MNKISSINELMIEIKDEYQKIEGRHSFMMAQRIKDSFIEEALLEEKVKVIIKKV